MITSVTLARGASRMAKDGVFVKRLEAIQNLGSIDILCSDKTGTLTARMYSLAGRSMHSDAPLNFHCYSRI